MQLQSMELLVAASNVWELVALVSDLVIVTEPTEAASMIQFNTTRLALLQAVCFRH
jgi:hypothetical protein